MGAPARPPQELVELRHSQRALRRAALLVMVNQCGATECSPRREQTSRSWGWWEVVTEDSAILHRARPTLLWNASAEQFHSTHLCAPQTLANAECSVLGICCLSFLPGPFGFPAPYSPSPRTQPQHRRWLCPAGSGWRMGPRDAPGTLPRRRLGPYPQVPSAARRSPCARRGRTRSHGRFSLFLRFSLLNSFFSFLAPSPLPAVGGGREKYCSQRSLTKWHLRTPRLASALRARPHRAGLRASVGRLRRVTKRSAGLRGGREDRREPGRGARGRAVRGGGG